VLFQERGNAYFPQKWPGGMQHLRPGKMDFRRLPFLLPEERNEFCEGFPEGGGIAFDHSRRIEAHPSLRFKTYEHTREIGRLRFVDRAGKRHQQPLEYRPILPIEKFLASKGKSRASKGKKKILPGNLAACQVLKVA
jgi:hypothetical protein